MKSVYCSRMRSCLIPQQRWGLLAGWRFPARSIASSQAQYRPVSTVNTLTTFAAVAATSVSAPLASTDAEQQRPASGRVALASHAHAKQTVDYTALAACCHELSKDWVPAKVEEVVQPDPYTLSLRLRTPLATSWLHLSWHPVAARVALGAAPPRGATSEAFTLVEQVGSALRGLVLTGAALAAPWERVVALDFAPRLTDPPAKRLICEVMAKYSNVVLTDEQGMVVVAAHQVGGAMSRLRQVQQGRPYQLPPPAAGLPPDPQESLAAWRSNLISTAQVAAAAQAAAAAAAVSGSDAAAGGSNSRGRKRPRSAEGISEPRYSSSSSGAAAGSLQAAMVRSYQAVSPSLAQELCEAAGVSPTAAPEQLSEGQWDQLHAAWQQWQQRLAGSSYSPTSCSSTGRFSMMGAYPQQHASAHMLLDTYYSSLQAAELHTSLHQRLSAAVGNALKKARGRVFSFKQQLQAAERVDAVQKQADLIMANVYRWPAGELSISAEDWDTGGTLTLTLPDKDTSPVAAAEAMYKKARKLRRATDALSPLLQAAEGEVEYLEQLESDVAQLAEFEGMADLQALREVQEELVDAKLIKPPAEAGLAAKAAAKGKQAAKKQQKAAKKGSGSGPAAAAAAAAAGGLGCREFVTPSGLQVLVGRNNKQNDVLSLQIANPQDLWMHVRGIPGSHCVLRLPNKGAEPADEDVQFAANLAAYFSKARDSTKVDVLVTRAEHVKKLKGGKPGQVLVSKESWGGIMARPGDAAASAVQRAEDA